MEARLSDDGTVSALDLELVDWEGTELTRVATEFYHALILFYGGKARKVVLTNTEGEAFEGWRTLVKKYQPSSKASEVGKLAEIFRTTFKGDLLDAITSIEGTVMIWEAQSHETISDSLNTSCVIAGMGQSSLKEQLFFSASECECWSNFVREVEATEHAEMTISGPKPMESDAFQGTCHRCGKYGHTGKECRSSGQGGAETPRCAQCGRNRKILDTKLRARLQRAFEKWMEMKQAGRWQRTRMGGKSQGGKGGTQERGKGQGKKGKRHHQLSEPAKEQWASLASEQWSEQPAQTETNSMDWQGAEKSGQDMVDYMAEFPSVSCC